MSMRPRGSLTEMLGWVLLGVGAGLSAGLLLGERIEWRGRRARSRPIVGGLHERMSIVRSVAAVRQELADHDDFAALDLTVRAVAPGVVELGGWVDDRRIRARLIQFARAIPGIDGVHDRLLVHGEDDVHHSTPRSQPRSSS